MVTLEAIPEDRAIVVNGVTYDAHGLMDMINGGYVRVPHDRSTISSEEFVRIREHATRTGWKRGEVEKSEVIRLYNCMHCVELQIRGFAEEYDTPWWKRVFSKSSTMRQEDFQRRLNGMNVFARCMGYAFQYAIVGASLQISVSSGREVHFFVDFQLGHALTVAAVHFDGRHVPLAAHRAKDFSWGVVLQGIQTDLTLKMRSYFHV